MENIDFEELQADALEETGLNNEGDKDYNELMKSKELSQSQKDLQKDTFENKLQDIIEEAFWSLEL